MIMQEYDLTKMTPSELLDRMRIDFQATSLIPRSRFRMYGEFITLLKNGIKKTTIRFRPEGIDYPIKFIVDLFQSMPKSENEVETFQQLKITKYVVKTFGELNDNDAKNDGFRSAMELKKSLQDIYGPIRDDQFVSIYAIEFVA